MSYNPAFDIRLKYGQMVEKSLAALLVSLDVEVKADDMAERTGNLCVEFEQESRDGSVVPSGIAISRAHWWAFVIGDARVVLVRRDKLLQYARAYYKKGCIKTGGDNGNRFVLVPIRAIFTEDF